MVPVEQYGQFSMQVVRPQYLKKTLKIQKRGISPYCDFYFDCKLDCIKSILMNSFSVYAIKPGPKPNKPDGTPDRRRRVTPETKPKHPKLKPHRHKPGD